MKKRLTYKSMMTKTACSSAGIGLHLALEAIRQGSISAAIVAGANLIMGECFHIPLHLIIGL